MGITYFSKNTSNENYKTIMKIKYSFFLSQVTAALVRYDYLLVGPFTI